MLIGMTVRSARPVPEGRSLSVETGPPTINGGTGNVEPADSGGNAEVKRILYNGLTEASDL